MGASPRGLPASYRKARPSVTPRVPRNRKFLATVRTRHICHLASWPPSDLVPDVGTSVTHPLGLAFFWGDQKEQAASCGVDRPFPTPDVERGAEQTGRKSFVCGNGFYFSDAALIPSASLASHPPTGQVAPPLCTQVSPSLKLDNVHGVCGGAGLMTEEAVLKPGSAQQMLPESGPVVWSGREWPCPLWGCPSRWQRLSDLGGDLAVLTAWLLAGTGCPIVKLTTTPSSASAVTAARSTSRGTCWR